MSESGNVPRAALSLLGAIALAGCVSASYIPTGAAYPPRSIDCAIEVFSAGPPARQYEELGVLEAEGNFWKADLEDVLPKLKEEACVAGGDALILQSASRYTSGEDGEETHLYSVATVVRWTERR